MTTFEQLGLSAPVLEAVTSLGFVNPTPIQEQAIPVLLTGNKDFVGLAQTGTGKTAAFGLPLLELVDFTSNNPQALILCPTRELCLQIVNDIKNYSKNIRNANVVAVYGGASITEQLRVIKKGVQIVVATPGRMLDILNRKAINFSAVNYVVLDEADEMLNMGFQEDIDDILATTPESKTTWLFSATMPTEVRKIAKKYMNDPFELTVGTKNTGNVNIDHEYYIVRPSHKYAALKRIVDYNPDIFAIVFSRTKLETQEIAEHLMRDGYNADSLHGDLSQQQRDKVMKRFRDRSLQILVATDVAARGIDVDSVTHVINYSLPDEVENYTHRSGRTARAGKTGVSLAIVSSREVGKIRQIEKIIGKKFVHTQIPNGFDVCEKQLFSIVHKVHNVEVNDDQIDQYMQRIYDEFADLSKEDVIKKFASIEFNRFLDYYKNAPDLNAAAEGRGDENSMRGPKGDHTRLFINVGSVDEFNRGDLLGFICNTAKIDGAQVGKIDIKGVYSFFEVQNDIVPQLLEAFKNVINNNRPVRIEISGASGGGGGDRRGGGRSGGGERRSYGGGGGERRSYGGGGGERRSSGGGYGSSRPRTEGAGSAEDGERRPRTYSSGGGEGENRRRRPSSGSEGPKKKKW